MIKIYTRTGDEGETGLFGGQRVPKDDLRVEAYGTVDELNAALGIAHALRAEPELDALLLTLQHDLFSLGADLATPEEKDRSKGAVRIERVAASRVDRLETLIDRYEAELPPLTRFILPGGHPLAAALHGARTVCRRAERRCLTLSRSLGELSEADEEPINTEVIRYLNRLSDLLFVLARAANFRHSVPDILWNP